MLELPEELQRRVEAKAKERNTTPEAIALSAIDDSVATPGMYITHLDTEGVPQPMPKTPAEATEYWERNGLIGPAACLDHIGDTIDYARALRANSYQRAKG